MNLSNNIKKFMGIVEKGKEKVTEEVRTAIYGGDPEKAAMEIVQDPSKSTPGWLDKEDAARHLLAIGGLAQKTNPTFAKGLAKMYEFISGSASEEDLKMDEHNNALALKLFNAKDFTEVKQRVSEMMKEAQYKDFSDKEKPVFLKLEAE